MRQSHPAANAFNNLYQKRIVFPPIETQSVVLLSTHIEIKCLPYSEFFPSLLRLLKTNFATKVVTGPCCSCHGWCGDTKDHCTCVVSVEVDSC